MDVNIFSAIQAAITDEGLQPEETRKGLANCNAASTQQSPEYKAEVLDTLYTEETMINLTNSQRNINKHKTPLPASDW